MITKLPQNERDFYEERAAIREFDGNQTRPDAERAAWRELMLERVRVADKKRKEKSYERRSDQARLYLSSS